MFELLQSFEQTAARFSPIVLIGPGVAVVLIGLFVWLGGLGFRRVLAAVLGAITGWICGFFIVGRNMMAASTSAVVAAVIAIIFQRIFITILAALLAVVLTFFVFTGICPEVIEATKDVPITAPEVTEQHVVIGIRHTPVVIKAYIADFTNMVKEAAWHMRTSGWATMAGLAVVLLIAGLFLRRLTSALCCAVLGTILVFAGMIWLLLYKGSLPISKVCDKPLYYAAVFGAMVVFGTIVQLLLCPRLEGRRKKRKGAEDAKATRSKNLWRT
jgi:hypothetical protein